MNDKPMTAPPDRIWAWVQTDEHGLSSGRWNTYKADADAFECVPLDGPTIRAAIAAAEARERKQGLREAADKCADLASDHADLVLTGLPKQARLREAMEAAFTNARHAILALTPAPPAAKEKPDE